MLVSTIEYISNELEQDVENLLLRHGFSFDIALQGDGSVQLMGNQPFRDYKRLRNVSI